MQPIMVPPIGEGFVSIKKNVQHNFPKMRAGQRPFGIFPKIQPFWYPDPSLKRTDTKIKTGTKTNTNTGTYLPNIYHSGRVMDNPVDEVAI